RPPVSFIRIKVIKKRRYKYLQRSYSHGGKVKTESIYLGPIDPEPTRMYEYDEIPGAKPQQEKPSEPVRRVIATTPPTGTAATGNEKRETAGIQSPDTRGSEGAGSGPGDAVQPPEVP